jgi:DNA-directed RNA polymerase specialized sigma24 family protein
MRLIARSCITPAAAFDALHAHCAGPVVRQVELLTGNPRLARRAVRHAFVLAWQHWPSVAVDPDPAGWIRAAAHDYALAPRHRLTPLRRPRRRARAGPGVALRTALLRLPPASRRAVLLYDGLGLDLPEAAAETAASTAAAAGRIMRARAKLGEDAAARLHPLLREARTARPAGPVLRRRSERRVRRQTAGAVGLTAAFALWAGVMAVADPVQWITPPATASVRDPVAPAAPAQAAEPAAEPAPVQQDAPALRRDTTRCAPYDRWCGAVVPREPFH